MSKQETLSETIIKWAATRSDESVLEPTHGYYPFEIIAEAFEKGVEHGEKKLKEKVRSHFFSNANLAVEAVNEAIKKFGTLSIYPLKLFVNISFESSKIILTFKEDVYTSDDFLNNAFDFSSDLKLNYFDKGLKLDISYLIDSDNLNLNILKSDGFEVALDLSTQKLLY
jgi:hypothetical protein